MQITVSSIHHAALPLNLLFTLALVSLALNLTHPKADFPGLLVMCRVLKRLNWPLRTR